MKPEDARPLVAGVSGLLFGAGLLVSGMTQPQKVLDFLDPLGQFDASLAFVMLGAIATHVPAYRWVKARSAPLFDRELHLPTRSSIDARLVLGAGVFGVGWGLSGYCPGPAIVSLAAGSSAILVFVGAMLAGMFVTAKLDASRQQRQKPLLIAQPEPTEGS